MPDLYTIKTEIFKNGKLVDSITENELNELPDYQINHLADVYFHLHIKDFNNGIYAKVASLIEYKYGKKLTEEAVRQRILKRRKKQSDN